MEIRVKHAGATHTLQLAPGDCLYRRVSAELNLPTARLTLLRAGKKLPPAGDPALSAAIVPGALYLAMGSRDELPSTTQRYLGEAKEAAVSLYSRMTYDWFVAMLYCFWSLLISLGRASISFVTSMVIAPDPARPGPRRGGAAPPQHVDAMPPG